MGNPVILSYGLGVDSTAILLRWILEPQSRDFDLADLTVVTAMTGDEWQQTGQLVEDHILPLMRRHRIRFVQVARSTASTAKATQLVLSDTTNPTVLHLGGVFKLSEEMRAAGTVPQRSGSRLCSAKSKGAPLDAFIEAFTAGRPYRHMIGFEANELGRAGNPAGPGVKAKGDCRFNTDLRHGEYPLIEWGWDRAKAIDYIRQHLGVTWVKSACVYCLSGDTEVVTRDGIRRIRDLAGGTYDILVPQVGTKGGLSTQGSFRPVNVRSFGLQQLYKVNLSYLRSKKTVYATADHRWILAPVPGARWQDAETFKTTTLGLQHGDRLRPLQANKPNSAGDAPSTSSLSGFAAAQGFTYGDGTKPWGNGPATLTIYGKGKAEAVLPLFAPNKPRKTKAGWHVYGLPRSWKALPDLRESRNFLLSWLAGYFAADGTVSKRGIATIHSADRTAIERVRDVAAICGVGYTPIRSRKRKGLGKAVTDLWQINLTVCDLPRWFFLRAMHAERADLMANHSRERRTWCVESVETVDRIEEVFCATVPGAEAFGLADDLMTGNCPFSMGANPDLPLALARYEERPREGAVPALMMEHRSLGFNPSQSLVERKRKVNPIRGLYELVSPHTWGMFIDELEATPHALYEMRRIVRAGEADPGKATWFARSLTVHATGTRGHMLAVLEGLADRFNLVVQRDGRDGVLARLWVMERDDVLPCREQMFCVGPVGTNPKRSEHFESWWDEFDREEAYA